MRVYEIAQACGESAEEVLKRLHRWFLDDDLKNGRRYGISTIMVEPILSEAYIAASLSNRIELQSGTKRQHKGKTSTNKDNESG